MLMLIVILKINIYIVLHIFVKNKSFGISNALIFCAITGLEKLSSI